MIEITYLFFSPTNKAWTWLSSMAAFDLEDLGRGLNFLEHFASLCLP
jgi:hypothetical protein